jgi:hypothetical protein
MEPLMVQAYFRGPTTKKPVRKDGPWQRSAESVSRSFGTVHVRRRPGPEAVVAMHMVVAVGGAHELRRLG